MKQKLHDDVCRQKPKNFKGTFFLLNFGIMKKVKKSEKKVKKNFKKVKKSETNEMIFAKITQLLFLL